MNLCMDFDNFYVNRLSKLSKKKAFWTILLKLTGKMKLDVIKVLLGHTQYITGIG